MKGDAAVSHGLASSPPRGEGACWLFYRPKRHCIRLRSERTAGSFSPWGEGAPKGRMRGPSPTERMMLSNRLLADLLLQGGDEAEALAQERIDGKRAAEGGERLADLALLDADEAEAGECAEVPGLQ